MWWNLEYYQWTSFVFALPCTLVLNPIKNTSYSFQKRYWATQWRCPTYCSALSNRLHSKRTKMNFCHTVVQNPLLDHYKCRVMTSLNLENSILGFLTVFLQYSIIMLVYFSFDAKDFLSANGILQCLFLKNCCSFLHQRSRCSFSLAFCKQFSWCKDAPKSKSLHAECSFHMWDAFNCEWDSDRLLQDFHSQYLVSICFSVAPPTASQQYHPFPFNVPVCGGCIFLWYQVV